MKHRSNPLIMTCIIILVTLATSWTVLAHGDDEDRPPTDQTETVTIDFVPNYAEHIAPIMEANCTSCHIEGELGHDSFEMDTSEEIIASADDIGLVVTTGYMPPWHPSDLSPEFLYDRSLTDEEKALILAWVENNAPSGDMTSIASSDEAQVQPNVEADLVIEMPAPYTPNANRTDDYRCFMLDPNFTEDTYIRGYEFVPDSRIMAHHTILYPGTEAMRAEVATIDGADGQAGWECFGGNGLSSGSPEAGMIGPMLPLLQAIGGISELQYILTTDDPVTQIDAAIEANDEDGTIRAQLDSMGGTETIVGMLGQTLNNPNAAGQSNNGILGSWVPGAVPAHFPDDTGLHMPAGSFFILQMHYNTQAGIEPDQSQLILDLADEDENPRSLNIMAINAPVEIPCPVGVESEACNRDVAIAESGSGSDLLLAACGQTLDDYADVDPENVTTYCDTRVLTSGWAISIMSHMHTLGKSTQTFLINNETGEETTLIDIPIWDFDWQGDYWFADPIWLNQGDIIRVYCTYDNGISRSNPEPRYTVAGEGTNDEMCLNIINMLPAEAGSQPPVTTIAHNHDDMTEASNHTDTHNHDEALHADAHNHDTPVDVDTWEAVPTVNLTVTEDASSGYNVRIDVENFTFAPQNASGEHIDGEGHAHLYVNGEKIARVYGGWYHIASLPVGTNTITVTLNSNTHAPLYINNAPISAFVEVEVTQ
ncbi:MAG: c-type cytochrome [Chloroflexota bacterium]